MFKLSRILIVLTALAVWSGCKPPAADIPDYEGPSAVVEITNTQQFDAVLKSEEVVLVDFWASWCAPCQALKPTIAEISESYKGRVAVLSVDVDEQQELASRYNIRSIPSVFIFANGKQAEKLVGALPKKAYTSVLDQLAPVSAEADSPAGG